MNFVVNPILCMAKALVTRSHLEAELRLARRIVIAARIAAHSREIGICNQPI